MARFLIDICHPAHAHFFRNPIQLLSDAGHEVLVTSRIKEMSTSLLDRFGVDHHPLEVPTQSSLPGMFLELIRRDLALTKVARKFQPDVITAIGGIFAAHAAVLARKRSIVFYDTENAWLQNLLTYPFATRVIVPGCYSGWVPTSAIRYRGYHELAYLHPHRFEPDQSVALENGLSPHRKTFLIRVVAWKANHDLGEAGWSIDLLRAVVNYLTNHGHVIISSETNLPPDLRKHEFGGDVTKIHHVMAYCEMYIGESATMASECAVLGVPAIYAANTPRGYTTEQEENYGLVTNVHTLDWPNIRSAIDSIMDTERDVFHKARSQLLEDCVDVSEFIAQTLEAHALPRKP